MYGPDQHLSNHICNSDLVHDSTLHVIRVISNPARYHSRYRLARQQEHFLKTCPNIKLYTVEAAFGDRHHEIVEKTNPHHLLVRIKSEIWIKENMINLGVKHLLPRHWKYLAWIDGDVIWHKNDWGINTIQQLQHYPVLQPWQDGLDLGRYENVLSHFKSFGFQHFRQFEEELRVCTTGKNSSEGWTNKNAASAMPKGDYRRYGHTGYAWACTRYFWENIGGLMDFCILGSADHNMALSFIGRVEKSIHQKMSEGFKRKCHEFQERALRVSQNEVGCTTDRLEHFFHGSKKRRYYGERWQILIHYKFDPYKDLMYDDQGIIKLVGKPGLEQAIRHYNRSRHEDSIDEGTDPEPGRQLIDQKKSPEIAKNLTHHHHGGGPPVVYETKP